MNVAIIGNGPSVTAVNWKDELQNKDLVIRLKIGCVKPLYDIEYFKINHYSILHINNFKKFTKEDFNILSLYKQIYILDYSPYKNLDPSNLLKDNNIKNINTNIIRTLNYFNYFNKNKEILFNFDKNLIKYFNNLSLQQINILSKFILRKNLLKKYKFPSTGLFVTLYFKTLYSFANITLYGFSSDNNSGWFWDPSHKHSSHDFKKEIEFLRNMDICIK